MNNYNTEEMDPQEAAAISDYEERKRVLSLGFQKYQVLIKKAIKLVRKVNKSGSLEGREKEEFLSIPLIIREKAINTVAYENI